MFSCSKKETEKVKPIIGDVTESVYASGVIKAEGQYTVYATVNGTLRKVNVVVGQSINKGQALFELESDKCVSFLHFSSSSIPLPLTSV